MESVASSAASAAWPGVRFESYAWDDDEHAPASRRARLRARGPYLAAVTPEIAATAPPGLSADLVVDAEDAVAELSRFDTEVGAFTAPFAAILLRSESASSSEIENLTALPRGIALAALGKKAGPNARLVVANVHAMEAALTLADDLDEAAVIGMHAALLADDQPHLTGSWRDQQVWIGGSGRSPHTADFVPPHADRVPAAMDDLIRFARRVDIPALAHVALTHAQFETIHPFPDGNGRTGRAIVHSMLRRLRITRQVTVPVSAGLLSDTSGYFAALGAYREGEVEPVVRAFVDATLAAVVNGRALVTDLTELRLEWGDLTSARQGSAGHRMLDLLQRQPVVDVSLVARELGVATNNARAGIDRLAADGIIRPIGEARRDRVFEAPDVLVALDAFAQRAKRRHP
ncbi:Fic family protein [Frigoribacterium sp. CFBP9039]|uniref:Fic family protein n=1 Tax=Frigoribacterium TaxID=96492 RepID=UPI0017849E43|nr:MULTISPECIES: Fic family protein [Frigoribacterium]MBD8703750.1 Fic family protein [Frigoribacterium sp. CFBP 13712]MCJ0702375.1 Fic family protein [Frigoribacterium faeni]MDY0892504.1 Fic family protein [Frigoribacterium sp. CFBP9030]MDY0946215.1 Fic family protein [Frigoribacterium sp. CFBP9039]